MYVSICLHLSVCLYLCQSVSLARRSTLRPVEGGSGAVSSSSQPFSGKVSIRMRTLSVEDTFHWHFVAATHLDDAPRALLRPLDACSLLVCLSICLSLWLYLCLSLYLSSSLSVSLFCSVALSLSLYSSVLVCGCLPVPFSFFSFNAGFSRST